jgi:hypothetical protein
MAVRNSTGAPEMKAPLVGMASSLVFFALVSGTALAEENAALAAKAKEILKTNCTRRGQPAAWGRHSLNQSSKPPQLVRHDFTWPSL